MSVVAPCEARPAGRAAGVALAVGAATVAVLLARETGAPAALTAVALGVSCGLFPQGFTSRAAAGLEVFRGAGLRLAVALLGAQLSWVELSALGAPAAAAGAAVAIGGVFAGVGLGLLVGIPIAEAVVVAAALSICGASAAMAVTQALPRPERLMRHAATVIVAVNLISLAAMVGLPAAATALGLSDREAGLFFGFAIQDVAQVIGAGAMVSPEAERIAALAKLSRILWLAPIVLAVGILARRRGERSQPPCIGPPGFLLGFVALATLRSLGLIPPAAQAGLAMASQALLAAAVFAVSASAFRGAAALGPPRVLLQLGLGATLVTAAALALAVAL